MKIEHFALERYFAKYEFSAKYLLSCSDCEALTLNELLDMADAETLKLWESLKLSYTETWGHPFLRELIADLYKGINAENTLVMVPEEGIFLLMQTLLKPGDHIVCAFPGYQSLYEIARSLGCTVTKWIADESNGWAFNIQQLDSLIQENTRLVVVNFPHNPTGYLPTVNEFQDIITLVREKNIYLLSDEMYRFLEIGENRTLPSACELYDKAFSLFGMSKSYGLPGLRIGWMVSQAKTILSEMAYLKDYTTICSSAPSEILAIIALINGDQIISRHKSRIHRNLKVLTSFLGQYKKHFSWNRPKGGSICFPRMLTVDNTQRFCDQLVEKSGIMLVPSSLFEFENNHIRIGFGRENLPEVIDRFSEYVEDYFE